MIPILSDLDELVLTVRDRNCRSYLEEAVTAYRGRAFRAAVVSTWIAVAYDIISKIQELSEHGEPAAKAFALEFDSAVSSNDVSQQQKIENSLLSRARDVFELIGPFECSDLERLKEDRNRCAHPAFGTSNVLFTPTPDLVRTHIVHAVRHLLCHPPVQGKTALARLKSDMLRPSFPSSLPDVAEFLESKYLKHSKVSLAETFVTVLVKILLRGAEPDLVGREDVSARTLAAISRSRPDIYERKMRELLPKLSDGIDDRQLLSAFALLAVDPRTWEWLGIPTQVRMKELARNYDFGSMDGARVLDGLCIDGLRDVVLPRFRALDVDSQVALISVAPRSALADDAIRIYSASKSYRVAESRAESLILPLAHLFSGHHVRTLLEAIADNSQLREASRTPVVVDKLFDLTEHVRWETADAWQAFLISVTLRESDADGYYAYPSLRKRLEQQQLWP